MSPVGREPDVHVPGQLLLTELERPDVEPGAPHPGGRGRGQFRDIWRRYRRNRLALVGLGIVVLLLLVAILQPYITPYDPRELNNRNSVKPPSAEHWFGTDKGGRDLFSGILNGARLAVIVGLSTMLLALIVGLSLGALAGYKGKAWDTVIMRITDIFLAFPPLIGAIILVRTMGAGVVTVILALALLGWTTTARVMRGQVLALREAEYVEAARSIGASDTRIVVRHIVPNAVAPVLILAFSGIGTIIVAMATLAFLGIGIPAEEPEWGRLVSEALPFLRNTGLGGSHLWIFPSLALVITTLGFAFVADGLRDALDPKLR